MLQSQPFISFHLGFAIRISGKKIFLLDTITTVAHRELVQLASNFISNELTLRGFNPLF